DAKAILDAHAGVGVYQLPGQFVGADIQAAPALCVGNEAGDGHGALEERRQFFAFFYIFPVAWHVAANFFLGVQLVGFLQLFVGIASWLAAFHFLVFGTLFAGM